MRYRNLSPRTSMMILLLVLLLVLLLMLALVRLPVLIRMLPITLLWAAAPQLTAGSANTASKPFLPLPKTFLIRISMILVLHAVMVSNASIWVMI